MRGKKLPVAFYYNPDVTAVAQQLLGKLLLTKINNQLTGGVIIETEAYSPHERASHAFGYRRTTRTEPMFLAGGHSYVYLCYGIHHLLNIVTNRAEEPEAVLIRSIRPIIGLPTMQKRRGTIDIKKLASGPGAVGQALGLTREDSGINLQGSRIWLEDIGLTVTPEQVIATARVGVSYAKEDAQLPWRFLVADSAFKDTF